MAYGKVEAPPLGDHGASLGCRLYPLRRGVASADRAAIVTVPFDCTGNPSTGIVGPVLRAKLWNTFNEEIEDGKTYPQERKMSMEEFQAYFLSYDLVIGVLIDDMCLSRLQGDRQLPASGIPLAFDKVAEMLYIDDPIKMDRCQNWDLTYGFSYYIKPNYPGRSSHLCNAGFLVPRHVRGMGLGGVAGQSFLFYGPRCGYLGSVFNLVYESNEASVKIWDKLGFERVGKLPSAGRLKGKSAGEELYVDAWIVYGDFQKIAVNGGVRGGVREERA